MVVASASTAKLAGEQEAERIRQAIVDTSSKYARQAAAMDADMAPSLTAKADAFKASLLTTAPSLAARIRAAASSEVAAAATAAGDAAALPAAAVAAVAAATAALSATGALKSETEAGGETVVLPMPMQVQLNVAETIVATVNGGRNAAVGNDQGHARSINATGCRTGERSPATDGGRDGSAGAGSGAGEKKGFAFDSLVSQGGCDLYDAGDYAGCRPLLEAGVRNGQYAHTYSCSQCL